MSWLAWTLIGGGLVVVVVFTMCLAVIAKRSDERLKAAWERKHHVD